MSTSVKKSISIGRIQILLKIIQIPTYFDLQSRTVIKTMKSRKSITNHVEY